MTDSTIVIYKSKGGEITFSVESDFWLTDITGLEMQVDINTSQNKEMAGQSVTSMAVSGRNMTFTGAICGDLQINRKKLINAVLPFENAEITLITDDGAYIIQGYVAKTPYIEPGAGIQVFQFEFFAPYPYFKTQSNKVYTLSGINPLWQTPFHMQENFYISKYSENMFVDIFNSGNVSQAFTINIYAQEQVTNPVIHNVTQNSFIKINKVLEKGDKFFISTHETDKNAGIATVFTQSGQSMQNGFKYINPESDLDMLILPSHNIFMADADENKTNLNCTLITAGGEYHSI